MFRWICFVLLVMIGVPVGLALLAVWIIGSFFQLLGSDEFPEDNFFHPGIVDNRKKEQPVLPLGDNVDGRWN